LKAISLALGESLEQETPVAYLGFGKGGHGERAERKPIRGSGAEPPAGSRGRAPGRKVRGAKHCWALLS